jgi:hypothetical protein
MKFQKVLLHVHCKDLLNHVTSVLGKIGIPHIDLNVVVDAAVLSLYGIYTSGGRETTKDVFSLMAQSPHGRKALCNVSLYHVVLLSNGYILRCGDPLAEGSDGVKKVVHEEELRELQLLVLARLEEELIRLVPERCVNGIKKVSQKRWAVTLEVEVLCEDS